MFGIGARSTLGAGNGRCISDGPVAGPGLAIGAAVIEGGGVLLTEFMGGIIAMAEAADGGRGEGEG